MGVLRLWDADSGKLLHEIKAQEQEIFDLAFSPNGKHIVTIGGGASSAKSWDAETGELLRGLGSHTSRVSSVAFSPDGKQFATGAKDGLRFWDAQTFELIRHCTTDDPKSTEISEMHWHPQEDRLLTISWNDTMLVWDPASGETDESYAWLNEVPELEFWFAKDQIAWNPAADRILALGNINAILDLPGYKPEAQASEPADAKGSLARDEVASASGLNPARGTGQIFEHSAGQVHCGGWSHDGKHFMLGGESLEMFIYDATTQEEVGRIRGHEGTITECHLNSDGTKILTASADGTAKVWEFPEIPQAEHWAEGGVAISPDGTHVALTGGSRNQVLIVNLDTNAVVGRFESPRETWLGHVAWDPIGKSIAVGSGNGESDSMIYVIDGQSAELLRTMNPAAGFVQFLAWHPTEDGILAVGQNTNTPMEFWNAETGDFVETQEYMSWASHAGDWSPDGRWLAYIGSRTEVVDWRSREIELALEDSDVLPKAIQFSGDGKLLATADEHSGIRLYDTETWKLTSTLTAQAGSVKELQWGPGNERLASIGTDGTLRLWDPVSGRVILTHDVGTKPRSLQWSQDGNTIVVSADKRLHVFRMGVTP